MNKNISIRYNGNHYDTITDTWLFIPGQNLHYGYFRGEGMGLNDASEYLIDILSGKGNFDKASSILENINAEVVDYFVQSCDILSSFFKENILGYSIMSARKKEKN